MCAGQVVIRRLPKPVIASVAGYAVGGGNILHMMCDITVQPVCLLRTSKPLKRSPHASACVVTLLCDMHVNVLALPTHSSCDILYRREVSAEECCHSHNLAHARLTPMLLVGFRHFIKFTQLTGQSLSRHVLLVLQCYQGVGI